MAIERLRPHPAARVTPWSDSKERAIEGMAAEGPPQRAVTSDDATCFPQREPLGTFLEELHESFSNHHMRLDFGHFGGGEGGRQSRLH